MKKKAIIMTLLLLSLTLGLGTQSYSKKVTNTTEKVKIGDNVYRYRIEYDDKSYLTVVTGKGAVTEDIQPWGDLIIETGVTEIPDNAVSRSGIEKITLPSTLKKIGKNAFKSCYNLKKIEIPSSVSEINGPIFDNCCDLKKIVNKSSVTIKAPRKKGVKYMGYTYYVDGKPAKEVKPGKTMIGKPKTFKLKLNLDGGKIKGKKPKTYKFGTNITLPKVKKKGYEFIGWSEKKNHSNGVSKLWRDGNYYGGTQKRYAQFAKVKITGGKKSIKVKCTNYSARNFIVYYATKKDRSDEVSYSIQNFNNKVYGIKSDDPKNTRVVLKGKYKYFKKNPHKSVVEARLPGMQSNKKYYVRLKYWDSYDGTSDDDTNYGYSNDFGKKAVKVK